jgi:hypothetical protein
VHPGRGVEENPATDAKFNHLRVKRREVLEFKILPRWDIKS